MIPGTVEIQSLYIRSSHVRKLDGNDARIVYTGATVAYDAHLGSGSGHEVHGDIELTLDEMQSILPILERISGRIHAALVIRDGR